MRTLHITGLTLSGFAVDASGRLQISIFGDDRSWKATLRVLAMPELGSRLAAESVVRSGSSMRQVRTDNVTRMRSPGTATS